MQGAVPVDAHEKARQQRQRDDWFFCPLKEWPEDMTVPLDHPDLPEGIRQAVLAIWHPGDLLHQTSTDQGIEWWLLDESGELIEAFWLE